MRKQTFFLCNIDLGMAKNSNQNLHAITFKPIGNNLLFWWLLYFDSYRPEGHQNDASLLYGLISISYSVRVHGATQGHRIILGPLRSVLSGLLSINPPAACELAIGIKEWELRSSQQTDDWTMREETENIPVLAGTAEFFNHIEI